MAQKIYSRRVRAAAKPAQITLSHGVAVALRNDLGDAVGLAIDIQNGEDTDANWLHLLRNLRLLETIVSAALVQAAQGDA